MEDDLEKLIQGVRNLRKFAGEEIVEVRRNIKSIIDRKSKDGEHIQHTLDHLLNLVLLGVGDEEFHELNDFYATFDFQGAEDYKKIYEELFEEKY
jgi:hypothetical protein